MKVAIALAVCGAVLMAIGAVLFYVPFGLMLAGAELLAAAYVVGYLEARREAA